MAAPPLEGFRALPGRLMFDYGKFECNGTVECVPVGPLGFEPGKLQLASCLAGWLFAGRGGLPTAPNG